MRKSARIYEYRARIPLVNGGRRQPASGWEITKAFQEAEKTFRQFKKPSALTPASWVGDHAGLGKNIRLCDLCASRWLGWTKSEGYVRVGKSVGDCMACQTQWAEVNRYMPEEKALKEKKQNATLR